MLMTSIFKWKVLRKTNIIYPLDTSAQQGDTSKGAQYRYYLHGYLLLPDNRVVFKNCSSSQRPSCGKTCRVFYFPLIQHVHYVICRPSIQQSWRWYWSWGISQSLMCGVNKKMVNIFNDEVSIPSCESLKHNYRSCKKNIIKYWEKVNKLYEARKYSATPIGQI